MFQDSPIYDRLVAERGDIPAGVRREADRLLREVEADMQPLRSLVHQPAAHPPPPRRDGQWQRVLPPAPGAGLH